MLREPPFIPAALRGTIDASPVQLARLSSHRLNSSNLEEAHLASLKILALTLLNQVESLEAQIGADDVPELNLQREVHRFEAAIIRSALAKTGGRQRRAARLLGVKVTTLNTKIKRLKILIPDDWYSRSPRLPVCDSDDLHS
jgi:DNA-binding NtrC family response regulator